MIRAGILVLVFALGLAIAALWYGQMHHLRGLVPGALPEWTARIAPEAGLRNGRMEWKSHGLVPELTLQWSAGLPGLSGWRWDVRLSGAGIDLAGEMRATFWPGRAEISVIRGSLDLGRLVPLPTEVAGMVALDAGSIQLGDLNGVPWAEGRVSGQVAGVAVASADLGSGPTEARMAPDGTWSVDVALEGGVSGAGLTMQGQLPDRSGAFELVVDDAAALPDVLRGLLSGAGEPEGAGWIVDGTLQAF